MYKYVTNFLLVATFVCVLSLPAVSHYDHLSRPELLSIIKAQHEKIKSMEDERAWLKFTYGVRGTLFGAIGVLSLYKLGQICFPTHPS